MPAAGQHSRITWTPPDQSFSVETPVPLERQPDEYGDPDPEFQSSSYASKTPRGAFILTIIKWSKQKVQSLVDDRFGGLQFMIGGDDDHDFKERSLKIDGFPAKEIVYDKQNNRGLFIAAGDRIYVLGFAGKTRADLKSDAANRFFSSFRAKKKS